MRKTMTMRRLLCALIFLAIVQSIQSQSGKVTISGLVVNEKFRTPIPFVNVTLKIGNNDSTLVGMITTEDGRFSIPGIGPGNYAMEFSYVGFQSRKLSVLVGQLNDFLDYGTITLSPDSSLLDSVVVTASQDGVSPKMDKKTFRLSDNISQAGGSVLESMKSLPGVTTGQDGRVQLRGSDKVMILVDGKQTALTGFGGQTGLDNIPASAVERIEIINNPSSKYDANGNAGIINIIYKKEKQDGLNGKLGLTTGLGALWIKEENFPGVRPQYQATPKVNPSLSLNYRKEKVNFFFQGDNLFTKTLNKNEFVDRFYDNGDVVRQQTKRNRTTNIVTGKAGMDLFLNPSNTLTVSGLFSSEKILDRGDEPFFNEDLTDQKRLWQFLEDELKTTVTAAISLQHKFDQPGRLLNLGFNYTFHREDEKYFFTNTLPTYTGLDSFKLISDEHVADFNVDYVQPLRAGRFETGLKFRRRYIPVNMQFKPGLNSPLDVNAGGWANYGETIPAVYGNYIFENRKFEIEAGIRLEYVNLDYEVNPTHVTYKSSGYDYIQPFPSIRAAWKLNDRNRLTLFYNRRVDRPNEVDIRIFPKYDDAEIIKVGNPELRPQFTNTFELGHKTNWSSGYLALSLYHKRMDATIARIASVVPGSNLIYNIFQNTGKSYSTGLELILSQKPADWVKLDLNLNGYRNILDGFTVTNKYPVENVFTAGREEIFSGNVKLNTTFLLPGQFEAQLSGVYLAPDLIPQGKILSRFSLDLGLKKPIQNNKGEVFVNATDIANTLNIRREVNGNGFRYNSADYYETQVFRIGYTYKF